VFVVFLQMLVDAMSSPEIIGALILDQSLMGNELSHTDKCHFKSLRGRSSFDAVFIVPFIRVDGVDCGESESVECDEQEIVGYDEAHPSSNFFNQSRNAPSGRIPPL
jgi:hypothetical protein